jgi:AhpD family alkylhydroperoxidase
LCVVIHTKAAHLAGTLRSSKPTMLRVRIDSLVSMLTLSD